MINHKFPARTEQPGLSWGSMVPSEERWPQQGTLEVCLEEMKDLVWIRANYFMVYKVLKHTDYCGRLFFVHMG